jgi:DNA-directed RNA polymerase specialized sigma24 family protein
MLKQDWELNSEAFQRFLGWLDAGEGSPGERYLEMRRRLVCYFERKRCVGSDDLADETLNRVARRLEEEGSIEGSGPAQYCYIVAKFVFLEYLRRSERTAVPYEENPLRGTPAPALPVSDDGEPDAEDSARRFKCLESCLEKLAAVDRSLILSYYNGERGTKIEHRRELAQRHGLTPNALSIRTCRIRNKLEACVSRCEGRNEVFRPYSPLGEDR